MTINCANKLQAHENKLLSHKSEECVHASSVNMFKNRIDKYLVKAGYTYNKGRLHLK